MYSFLLNKEVKEENLCPCYFFYGEDTFLAYQLVEDFKKKFLNHEQDFNRVESFNLEENSWAQVVDAARTAPFLISSWRLIVVEVSEEKGRKLSSSEYQILREYFSSPSSQTILIIILSERKKENKLINFLTSLPSSVVYSRKLKPLKGRALFSWINQQFMAEEKKATPEAQRRLRELTGGNLRLLSKEIEKIITYVGDKTPIELDDINQVCGFCKSSYEWEILDNLEKGDYEGSLLVLHNLFQERVKPEYMVGLVAKFFRDLLMAKLWLKEGVKNKKEVFKELKPQIKEKFGNFYTAKFNQFFSVVDSLSLENIDSFLNRLERIDLKIKTSGSEPQFLLEGFIREYCSLNKKRC